MAMLERASTKAAATRAGVSTPSTSSPCSHSSPPCASVSSTLAASIQRADAAPSRQLSVRRRCTLVMCQSSAAKRARLPRACHALRSRRGSRQDSSEAKRASSSSSSSWLRVASRSMVRGSGHGVGHWNRRSSRARGCSHSRSAASLRSTERKRRQTSVRSGRGWQQLGAARVWRCGRRCTRWMSRSCSAAAALVYTGCHWDSTVTWDSTSIIASSSSVSIVWRARALCPPAGTCPRVSPPPTVQRSQTCRFRHPCGQLDTVPLRR